MRKRGLCLLLLVVLALSAVPNIQAQNSTVTFLLILDTDAAEPNFTQNLLQDIQTLLAAEGIDFKTVPFSLDVASDFNIALDLQIHGAFNLGITILETTPDTTSQHFYITAPVSEHAQVKELLQNSLIALSLYSVGRCDAVNPYLQTAQLEIDRLYPSPAQSDTSVVWADMLAFVMNNCSPLSQPDKNGITPLDVLHEKFEGQ